MPIADIRSMWRGLRGTIDLHWDDENNCYRQDGALVIRSDHTNIELVGTRDELTDLLARITAAMTADSW
jgi:hypothetical protein